MSIIHHLLDALGMAGSMTWQITWSLVLGFILSAVVQAVVRREVITRMLADDRPSTLLKATGLGVASSSCSYAAVALARSLFRKGASAQRLVGQWRWSVWRRQGWVAVIISLYHRVGPRESRRP